MTHFLLDNSVLQRLDLSAEVRTATQRLIHGDNLLAASDVSVLEAGYSATSAADHARILERVGGDLLQLPLTPEVGQAARELQTRLFDAGMGRAVGVVDLLHGATAIVHDAVLVHYDGDFEHLASVDSRLEQRWIVPRGSVD